MDLNKLKQEAEECMHNALYWLKLPISKENVEQGGSYILKLLEPREKRISELEEEVTRLRNENLDIINKYTRFAETDRRTIAELERKLEQTEKDLADYQFNYPTIKELQKELDYQKQARSIAENAVVDLQKENAELKEELKKWKDEWQEQVQKATDEGYARTLQTMQLTKATEIIKKYLSIGVGGKITQNYLDVTKQAEQFLKENSTYERIQKAKYNYTD